MKDRETGTMGVRAKAKATVRQRIVDAAMRLFGDEGYDAVSTIRIAEAAGVTQRTVFRYFPRKDLIVYAAADEVSAFECALENALDRGDPPHRAVLAALTETAVYCEQHRGAMRAFAALLGGSASLRSSEFDRQLRLEWLCALALAGADAFRARAPDPELRYRMMAGSVIGMTRPVVCHWQAGATYSLVEAIAGTAEAIAALLDHSNACYEKLPVSR
ncbi:TetR/AcrR family transcriptional regulator [Sphingomonadaceae bacterium jetA1]|uniref:TetR/AcrR family transcriptional regulator n=1 Tax=Facivitalis istanbulensis TaxID=3075838 RepID=UPI003470BD68